MNYKNKAIVILVLVFLCISVNGLAQETASDTADADSTTAPAGASQQPAEEDADTRTSPPENTQTESAENAQQVPESQPQSTPAPEDELTRQGNAVEYEADLLIDKTRQRREEEAKAAEASANEVKPGDIRVTHVPESVKEEIREELRGELRTDVLEDLIQHASTQRWGLPDAQPEWFSRVKLKGDFRLRGQGDMFADDNVRPPTEPGYIDYLKVNQEGGTAYTDPEDRYFNTWEDRQRLRIRARLGLDAKITEGLKVAFRISTGNTRDPVSTNQTLGQYGNRYDVVWDQAYIEYKGPLSADNQWLKLSGGRMPNPFFSTDMIWDNDLAFEGVASRFTINLRGSDDLMDITENDRNLFIVLGAFPLQEVELSSEDKWLFGAQLGTHFIFENQSSFKIAVSYYDFYNIAGKRNEQNSKEYDYTAPQFMQKGNLLYNIRNDPADLNAELWALASDYQEVAITLEYDLAVFAPVHVILTAEAVQNIGYDKDKINERTGGLVERSGGIEVGTDPLEERTMGYHAAVTVGWPQVTLPGNWRFTVAYKRLEADAVVDAFTDSDFHLGGTDARGFKLTYEHGINENAWFALNYYSATEIASAPFSVETIQLDLNAKF